MSRLFQYGPSLLSPSLWQEVVEQLPDVLTRAGRLFADWFNLIYARADLATLIFLFAVAVFAPALVWFSRRFLRTTAERLSNSFDTRVTVSLGKRKGKIVVEFGSVDDLQRIVELMKGGFELDSKLGEGTTIQVSLPGDALSLE